MTDIIYKDEAYNIIGACMAVHHALGKGFNEIVYKDALEIEFTDRQIYFEREKKFEIRYKNILLPHYYITDFILMDQIILEVKAIESLSSGHIKQTLNYLAASKLRLGLLVNFGEDSLSHKRVAL
jgi:hypothetical protein